MITSWPTIGPALPLQLAFTTLPWRGQKSENKVTVNQLDKRLMQKNQKGKYPKNNAGVVRETHRFREASKTT